MTTNAEILETQLSNLIGTHADWLDGPAWAEITERVGRGLFHDYPDERVIKQIIDSARDALVNAPIQTA